MTDKPVYTQEMHDRGELPPVGCKALLHNDEELNLEYGHNIIGHEVRVVSGLLYNSGSTKLVSVEYGGICYCFSVEMLRPLPQPTEREKNVASLTRLISCAVLDGKSPADLASTIVGDGYRKPKPKEEQIELILGFTLRPLNPEQDAIGIYNALNGNDDE